MGAVIYYMTGTGNSLQTARTLAAQIPDCEIRSMATALRTGQLQPEAETVGLVFPVYFFGLPQPVRRMIAGGDWGKVDYTFAVATCGNMPGASLHHVAEALRLAGGKLDAGFVVQQPDNYLPMFEMADVETQRKSNDAMAARAEIIAKAVTAHERLGIEPSKMRFDRYLAPLIYPKPEKLMAMDRHFWITDNCNRCGLCVKLCPFSNLQIVDGEPRWLHHCEMCLRCIHACPEKAIQYKKGTLTKGRYLHPAVTIRDLMADGSEKGKSPEPINP